jgi:hypothetical protein
MLLAPELVVRGSAGRAPLGVEGSRTG